MIIARSTQPTYPYQYDLKKGIEVLLYIVKNAPIPDRIHICKILYLADKYHLGNYARPICGDHYVAMEHGPVPSETYDLIKAAENGNIEDMFADDLGVSVYRHPDLDYFSESDIEALDWAIREVGSLSFPELRAISHDAAWIETTDDGKLLQPPHLSRSIIMPLEKILSTIEGGDVLLECLYEY